MKATANHLNQTLNAVNTGGGEDRDEEWIGAFMWKRCTQNGPSACGVWIPRSWLLCTNLLTCCSFIACFGSGVLLFSLSLWPAVFSGLEVQDDPGGISKQGYAYIWVPCKRHVNPTCHFATGTVPSARLHTHFVLMKPPQPQTPVCPCPSAAVCSLSSPGREWGTAHPGVSWFRELNQQEIIGLFGWVFAGLALWASCLQGEGRCLQGVWDPRPGGLKIWGMSPIFDSWRNPFFHYPPFPMQGYSKNLLCNGGKSFVSVQYRHQNRILAMIPAIF